MSAPTSDVGARGLLTVVLHAHLPFIRHPEYRYHLEENWLYEACAATYLPLLDAFQRLQREGVRFRVTMSMSPTLLAMLQDGLLRNRTRLSLERLVRLGDQELQRTSGEMHQLARFYRERFGRLLELYDDLDGDLVAAYRELADAGVLELITVGGTHGFQPTMREPAARRAQIRVAVDAHKAAFGRAPRGIWLPECGYAPGVDELLADHGIEYFFVDSHGIENAAPRPPHGPAAPVVLPSGVVAFARDAESSRQVWSADEGYPGDPVYRDFYRDIGFDLPLSVIGDFVHPDGIRVHTGFKYHRVTGKVDLADKLPYDPARAAARVVEHAADFLAKREAETARLGDSLGIRPLMVAPYDAELYGHWWFEGPAFLESLLRQTAAKHGTVSTATPSEVLRELSPYPVDTVSPSSWGDGGYSAVWVDPSNDWIYRHQHHAERRMVELARDHKATRDPVLERALTQAARELLLLQSSDWAFILKGGTAMGYATSRVKAHVARFARLEREICAGPEHIDQSWLSDLERRDNLFPDLDFRVYAQ